jgi:hypothetical protein
MLSNLTVDQSRDYTYTQVWSGLLLWAGHGCDGLIICMLYSLPHWYLILNYRFSLHAFFPLLLQPREHDASEQGTADSKPSRARVGTTSTFSVIPISSCAFM